MIKHILTLSAALLAVTLGIAATAFASPPTNGSILIRHQMRGCHSWSLNGGAFKASQTVTLGAKSTLTITNNDVMPHKLIETSGPAVRLQTLATPMSMGMKGHFGPGVMAHMGATTKVTFPAAGVYVFTTKAGEDYMKGVKTVGEDNALKLVVHVR
jgi:hypothetical protein